jgi:hypothetical protein
MTQFTVPTVSAATAGSEEFTNFVGGLLPSLLNLFAVVQAFAQQPPTPALTCAFEQALKAVLRETGRCVVEREYNRVEPERLADCPLRLELAGQEYRRRPKSPKQLATLFGEIKLRRYLYEATEAGEAALFPLELQLGVEAGLATPALAERVGCWATDHEQDTVLSLLRQEHSVSWSVTSLRKVTASLRDGLASFREEAQVARVLELLGQALASRGRHRPVLAVGRDGVHVPIRGHHYQEGSTATVSVLDRRGRRLGTVYLGQMPEAGQGLLSAQLTALVEQVLTAWQAQGHKAPRLVYVTDGGNHPKDYYLRVLRHLPDPWRPGQQLVWQWVLDFWHACGRVHDLAAALFGVGTKKAANWFAKWRRWLRDRRQGLAQVLRSAMWHYNNAARWSAARRADYWTAYRYLRKHGVWMKYWLYRQQGLPLGSGVTEAACKTVFAERLKRSGMTWCCTGGQVIVDLRVLQLSGVWRTAHQAYLRSRPQVRIVKPASSQVGASQRWQKAA